MKKKIMIIGICFVFLFSFVGCSTTNQLSNQVVYFNKPEDIDLEFYKSMLGYYEYYYNIAYNDVAYDENRAKIIHAELSDYSDKIKDGIYLEEDRKLLKYILQLQYEYSIIHAKEVVSDDNLSSDYQSKFEEIKETMYSDLNL